MQLKGSLLIKDLPAKCPALYILGHLHNLMPTNFPMYQAYVKFLASTNQKTKAERELENMVSQGWIIE